MRFFFKKEELKRRVFFANLTIRWYYGVKQYTWSTNCSAQKRVSRYLNKLAVERRKEMELTIGALLGVLIIALVLKYIDHVEKRTIARHIRQIRRKK